MASVRLHLYHFGYSSLRQGHFMFYLEFCLIMQSSFLGSFYLKELLETCLLSCSIPVLQGSTRAEIKVKWIVSICQQNFLRVLTLLRKLLIMSVFVA